MVKQPSQHVPTRGPPLNIFHQDWLTCRGYSPLAGDMLWLSLGSCTAAIFVNEDFNKGEFYFRLLVCDWLLPEFRWDFNIRVLKSIWLVTGHYFGLESFFKKQFTQKDTQIFIPLKGIEYRGELEALVAHSHKVKCPLKYFCCQFHHPLM